MALPLSPAARSAVRRLAEAAVVSGLCVAQRDDFPVTVQSGHSVSELTLAPEPILETGGTRPDALLLLSEDGCKKVDSQLAAMAPEATVFRLPEIGAVKTAARVVILDPTVEGRRIAKGQLAWAMVAESAVQLGLVPREALEEPT